MGLLESWRVKPPRLDNDGALCGFFTESGIETPGETCVHTKAEIVFWRAKNMTRHVHDRKYIYHPATKYGRPQAIVKDSRASNSPEDRKARLVKEYVFNFDRDTERVTNMQQYQRLADLPRNSFIQVDRRSRMLRTSNTKSPSQK